MANVWEILKIVFTKWIICIEMCNVQFQANWQNYRKTENHFFYLFLFFSNIVALFRTVITSICKQWLECLRHLVFISIWWKRWIDFITIVWINRQTTIFWWLHSEKWILSNSSFIQHLKWWKWHTHRNNNNNNTNRRTHTKKVAKPKNEKRTI